MLPLKLWTLAPENNLFVRKADQGRGNVAMSPVLLAVFGKHFCHLEQNALAGKSNQRKAPRKAGG